MPVAVEVKRSVAREALRQPLLQELTVRQVQVVDTTGISPEEPGSAEVAEEAGQIQHHQVESVPQTPEEPEVGVVHINQAEAEAATEQQAMAVEERLLPAATVAQIIQAMAEVEVLVEAEVEAEAPTARVISQRS